MDSNQTFVNLLMDSGFKAVYADKANKTLLISLLNLLLPAEAKVHDIIEYRDREQARDSIFSKKTILDLVCADEKGNIFSVEVQREVNRCFFQRCVYYAAGHYHSRLLDGKDYDNLHPVYFIAFLKEKYPHIDESQWDTDNLVSEYCLVEKRTKEFAPATIFISFVELGRFTKSELECLSERDRVFYWFNNSYMASESPECASEDPKMQSLIEATRIAAFTPEKKEIYNRDVMTELDIQYGEKIKFLEGKAEGKAEAAKGMKAEGLPIDIICRVTGLDTETIEAL